MNKYWLTLTGVILAIFLWIPGAAQGLEIDFQLDTMEITVGVPVKATLKVKTDQSRNISVPAPGVLFPGFNLIDFDHETTELESEIQYTQQYTVTRYTPGSYSISKFPIAYHSIEMSADSGEILFDPGMTLEVLAVSDPEAQDILDVEAAINLKQSGITKIIWFSIVGLILLCLAVYIYYVKKRSGDREEKDIPLPQWTQNQLELLRNYQFGSNPQEIVDYLDRCSDFLRMLVDRAFSLDSLYRPPLELRELYQSGLELQKFRERFEIDEIIDILDICDTAKFARGAYSVEDARMILSQLENISDEILKLLSAEGQNLNQKNKGGESE